MKKILFVLMILPIYVFGMNYNKELSKSSSSSLCETISIMSDYNKKTIGTDDFTLTYIAQTKIIVNLKSTYQYINNKNSSYSFTTDHKDYKNLLKAFNDIAVNAKKTCEIEYLKFFTIPKRYIGCAEQIIQRNW